MSRFVLLEPARHARLRLNPAPRGGTAVLVQLGRSEIPLAIGDYPLFLAKDEASGRFGMVALVGLTEPRNLFWIDGRWSATYLPEILFCSPFRLSSENATGLAIDPGDGRLGPSGDALFTEAGDEAPALIRERERLERVVRDVEDGRRTAAALAGAGVLRPVVITLSSAAGSPHLLQGLYSPDPEALAALEDQAVVGLFRSGDLAAAALLSASLCQLERLRQLHNATGRTSITDVDAELG